MSALVAAMVVMTMPHALTRKEVTTAHAIKPLLEMAEIVQVSRPCSMQGSYGPSTEACEILEVCSTHCTSLFNLFHVKHSPTF